MSSVVGLTMRAGSLMGGSFKDENVGSEKHAVCRTVSRNAS